MSTPMKIEVWVRDLDDPQPFLDDIADAAIARGMNSGEEQVDCIIAQVPLDGWPGPDDFVAKMQARRAASFIIPQPPEEE
jgi:hypothetical protein